MGATVETDSGAAAEAESGGGATSMLTMGGSARAAMQILGQSKVTLALGTFRQAESERASFSAGQRPP